MNNLKVVALVTNEFFKKGDVFNVKNIKGLCSCMPTIFDIGIESNKVIDFNYCSDCDIQEFEGTFIQWFPAQLFTSYEEEGTLTIEELFKELKETSHA